MDFEDGVGEEGLGGSMGIGKTGKSRASEWEKQWGKGKGMESVRVG